MRILCLNYMPMKNLKTILLAGMLMFGASALQAQATKPKDTTLTIKYLISSDWTFTFGNLNSFITVNQGQLNIEQRVIGTKLLARYRYGVLDSVVNNNEFYTNLDVLLFPKNRVYGFANGGFEFSFLRGINARAWGGLGAGFKVLNNDMHKFEPTVAFNFEHNSFANPVLYRGDSTFTVNTAIANIGWTGSHKFFKDKLRIVHNFLWTQDMLYATNYKFTGGLTISVPVIKNLTVKTSVLGSYNNVVPADKKPGDLIWTIGVAWGNI